QFLFNSHDGAILYRTQMCSDVAMYLSYRQGLHKFYFSDSVELPAVENALIKRSRNWSMRHTGAALSGNRPGCHCQSAMAVMTAGSCVSDVLAPVCLRDRLRPWALADDRPAPVPPDFRHRRSLYRKPE